MTTRFWRQALPAVGLVFGLTYGGEAQACSVELCSTEVLPRKGVTVPANAPQMKVQLWSLRLPTTAAEAELVDHEGTVLARGAFEGGVALVETTALVEGHDYRLRFPDSCGASTENGSVREVEFRAGPAAPFPSVLGTLAVTGSLQESYLGPPEACFLIAKTALVDLVLTPDALVLPFRPVFAAELVLESGEVVPLEDAGANRWVGRVHAACARSGLDRVDGLPEGEHRGEVRGRILGASSALPPLPVSFSLRCEAPVEEEAPPPASTGCAAAGSSPQFLPLVAGVWLRLMRRRSVNLSRGGLHHAGSA